MHTFQFNNTWYEKYDARPITFLYSYFLYKSPDTCVTQMI